MQTGFSSARPHGPGRTPAFVFSALMLILGGALPLNSLAQAAQQPGDGLRDYAVSGGALDNVLLAIARDSGTRISYDSDLVRPYQSAGLHGRYTARQAIETVLRGTPLRLHAGPDGQWSIQRQAVLGQGGAVTTHLPTITVNDSFALAATLTEDSPSYTADAVQIGSKDAQTLREIPQSVSVVTQQQIRDQGLRTLADALDNTAGITVGIGNEGKPTFHSRSFEIERAQIDGGSSVSLSNVDLAIFDHVEILRGADGVFVGRSDPGGSINLVRKRPTNHWRYSVEGSIGSWNDQSIVLDAGGPLGDSPVRARVIAKYADKDYFYDTASERKQLLYGITETRIGRDTLLTLGGSLHRLRGTPAYNGVPFYRDGSDLKLDRSTSFTVPWAFEREDKTEVFAQLDHTFNDRWSTRLNLNHTRTHNASQKVGAHGSVDPATGKGPVLVDVRNQANGNTTSFDLALNGRIEALGRDHDMTLGVNHSYYSSPGSYMLPRAFSFYEPYEIDVWDFDPQRVPRPLLGEAYGESPNYLREYSYFARFRFHLTDKLRLGLGTRLSNFDQKMDVQYWDEQGRVVDTMPSNYYTDNNVLTRFAGLTYDINPNWTVYGSYADVYQAQSNFFKIDGSTLKPIVGDNREIGVKTQWLDGRLQANLALYDITQNNFGQFDDRLYTGELNVEQMDKIFAQEAATGGFCCFFDTGKLVSRGVDLELSGDITDNLKISASYNYNRNKWKSYETIESGTPHHSQTPRHQFKLWTSYRLPGSLHRWTLAAGLHAQSKTYTEGTAPTFAWEQQMPFRINRPGYTLFNAAASYQINKNWNAQLNVNNVFDKHYYKSVNGSAFSNWYGTPRSFLLTVRGQF